VVALGSWWSLSAGLVLVRLVLGLVRMVFSSHLLQGMPWHEALSGKVAQACMRMASRLEQQLCAIIILHRQQLLCYVALHALRAVTSYKPKQLLLVANLLGGILFDRRAHRPPANHIFRLGSWLLFQPSITVSSSALNAAGYVRSANYLPSSCCWW